MVSELKLINPLAVRFSQPKIQIQFTSGEDIHETLGKIGVICPPQGSGTYNHVLVLPFPPITVLRWRPKLRDEDGQAIYGEDRKSRSGRRGRAVRGDENWFTLDNRRLYCMQRKATQLWPAVIGAPVRVLDVWGDENARRSVNLRKFRTSSCGQSIRLVAVGETSLANPVLVWNWLEATVRQAQSTGAIYALERIKAEVGKTQADDLVRAPPVVCRNGPPPGNFGPYLPYSELSSPKVEALFAQARFAEAHASSFPAIPPMRLTPDQLFQSASMPALPSPMQRKIVVAELFCAAEASHEQDTQGECSEITML